MSVSSEDFRTALSRFASGVTVVTTKDGNGKLHGITVSAFCSVSLDPPLVLICIERSAGSHYAFGESGSFNVNVLASDQANVSEHFATVYDDKFLDTEHVIGENGIPYLPGSIVTLECKLKKPLDGGDHSIFLGEVQNAIVRDGDPLVYYHGNYRSLAD
ncbi:MAG: flavin reductase family protein [Pyrinomonadaceae bacterium]|nr:flavin reductase family protein [Blastocatellia bacterium]MCW5955637.1 flavin reductase family protein [Pyrinomonadaceae bacterium]